MKEQTKNIIISIVGLLFILVLAIYGIWGVGASYSECKKYFSTGYCFTHPNSWPIQKGFK